MKLPLCLSRVAIAVSAALFSVAVPAFAADENFTPLPSFAEPAISPDGQEIAFVHAGDIWVVPAKGGVVHLLVSNPATESRPLYSPDGKKLAFISNRTGNGDVYVLTFATGDLKRITFDDGLDQLDGWSHDGQYIYFSSTVADLGASNADIYRVRAEGGTPMVVSGERYTNEFFSAPSPDGKVLAMSAGASSRDWWRNGHSNWNEAHIWLRKTRGDKTNYEEVTKPGARELWPMWGPGGKTLYCVADRDGPQNIIAYKMDENPRPEPTPVTQFKDGRVLWPSISANGKTIVFERDFGIWKLNPAGGTPEQLAITLRGAPAAETQSALNFVGGFRDLAVSPDGKKIAFVVHGEVFAVSARDGGRATRVTNTPAAEGQLDWAPDSRRLVYVSERGGFQNIYLYDFATQTEIPLTKGDVYDSAPRFSPDGQTLAFRRNGTELRLMTLINRRHRLLAGGLSATLPPFDDMQSPMAFSPKGQWIAYIDSGKRGFDNVFVISTRETDPKPQQVTFFANTGSNSVSWSGDGRSLMFGTGMRTEDYQLARVDLIPRQPNFNDDQFRGLFEEEMRTTRPGGPRPTRPQIERPPVTSDSPFGPTTVPVDLSKLPTSRPATQPGPPATQPVTQPASQAVVTGPVERFSLENIRQRVSLLSVGADVENQVVSPDGKWCVYIGSAGGRQNLYAYPLDAGAAGESAVRQLTSTTSSKSYLRFAPDSREVYFLEGGQLRAVSIDTRSVREIGISAPMETDFAQEKMEVAKQAWMFLKLNFYDPAMHGSDWEAVRKVIMPRIAGAKTSDEMRRILSIMIGELNASHLGISSPTRGNISVGRLGVRFDRTTYEKEGFLRVSEVVTGSPAEQAGIKVGDALLKVDGEPADHEANLDNLLDRKIGRRVVLRMASDAARQEERDVPIRPMDMGTEKTLLYRDWVEKNRAYVAKASGGRLGYVHIADMTKNALTRLNADLDAEAATRDGVVVDIRANTGGFVSPYVLDVLSRKGYLTIGRRGATESPGRMYVGQRALDLPTILVTNRQAISDAENFTEGYRTLKLGKVVGEPTAGGVIFTSDVTLLDGTTCRIPFSKVTGHDGKSLEGDGRPVDVLVRRPIGENQAGKDSQLDAAVKEIIKQIDRPKQPAKPKAKEAVKP